MDEVQLDAGEVRLELGQRVDACFVRPPIEFLFPISGQVTDRSQAGPGRPCREGRLVGQARARQALAQVGQRVIGNVKFERSDGALSCETARMPIGLQFICKKCAALSNVQKFEQTSDGIYFCRCENCAAKNKVVQTGASPSQPGLLPVTGLVQ
jgi:hypothetical protein